MRSRVQKPLVPFISLYREKHSRTPSGYLKSQIALYSVCKHWCRPFALQRQWVSHTMQTHWKREMVRIQGGMKCDVLRIHYVIQNGGQLQTDWLFISSAFLLAFLELGCRWITGMEESKTKIKGRLISAPPLSQQATFKPLLQLFRVCVSPWLLPCNLLLPLPL